MSENEVQTWLQQALKAVTVEVEVEKVQKTRSRGDYPVHNILVPHTCRVDEKMISQSRILKVPGFENFPAAWQLHGMSPRSNTGN